MWSMNLCSVISKVGLLLYSWNQLYYPEAAWWFGNPNQTEHVLTVAPADFERSCGGQLAWRKLGPCRWISPTSVLPWYLHISSVSWLWLGGCAWHPADVPGSPSCLLTSEDFVFRDFPANGQGNPLLSVWNISLRGSQCSSKKPKAGHFGLLSVYQEHWSSASTTSSFCLQWSCLKILPILQKIQFCEISVLNWIGPNISLTIQASPGLPGLCSFWWILP